MSEENVEVGDPVMRLLAAFNDRDWDALAAELAPEVEYGPVEEHAPLRGPEAITQYARKWLEAWDTFSADVEEVASTPAEGRVLIEMRLGGMGKGSGVEINDLFFWVCELRGGRVYRISEYTDRAKALETAGLAE